MGRTVGDALKKYRDVEVPTHGPERSKVLYTYVDWFMADPVAAIEIQALEVSDLDDCRTRLLLRNRGRTNKGHLSSNATTNRYFQTFFRVLSMAEKNWGWREARGYAKLPRLPEAKARTEFLNADQRQRLLSECKKSLQSYLYLIVVIGITTGARRGEIQSLRWSNINFDTGTALVPHTKNGEAFLLALRDDVLELLRQHKAKSDPDVDFVFPSRFDPTECIDIYKSWCTARNNAGLPKSFVFHNLRHSFASDLANQGVDLQDIGALLNHKTVSTTKRYAHLARERLNEVARKFSSKI